MKVKTITTECDVTGPELWAVLRAQLDTPAPPPDRFRVGDIIDASKEIGGSSAYMGAYLEEVVVCYVDDDETLKFEFVNKAGIIEESSWAGFNRCKLIHRIGEPLPVAVRPAPQPERQRPPDPAERYSFTGKNPGFGE